MPLATTSLPFGLRNVKISPITGGSVGASVNFPNSRTLSFTEAEDFEELRGDDGVVAVHGLGSSADWELEGGGVNFEAVKAMYGGTITETGTTPDIKKDYHKSELDERPYFLLEGQAISDSGGDFHVILYRCRATGEFSGEMADGSFWLTAASGRAIGRSDNDRRIYTMTMNEAAVAIS